MVSLSGPRSAAGDLGLGEGVGDAFPAPARKFSDKIPGALYCANQIALRDFAVLLTLMHNPPEEQLENLLPANWLATRLAARQTIESRVAWMPVPPGLWQKSGTCHVGACGGMKKDDLTVLNTKIQSLTPVMLFVWVFELGHEWLGHIPLPITGTDGICEFLAWLDRS